MAGPETGSLSAAPVEVMEEVDIDGLKGEEWEKSCNRSYQRAYRPQLLVDFLENSPWPLGITEWLVIRIKIVDCEQNPDNSTSSERMNVKPYMAMTCDNISHCRCNHITKNP